MRNLSLVSQLKISGFVHFPFTDQTEIFYFDPHTSFLSQRPIFLGLVRHDTTNLVADSRQFSFPMESLKPPLLFQFILKAIFILKISINTQVLNSLHNIYEHFNQIQHIYRHTAQSWKPKVWELQICHARSFYT